MADKLNLLIKKGSTFKRVLRWEAGPTIFRPITGISKAAPAVVNCADHGIPEGWRVAFESVVGMTQVNAENSPPGERDYWRASVVDADTIQIPELNTAGFQAYRSGGYLRFNSPVPLTDYDARMSIKDRIGGTELLRLDTTAGGIVIDEAGYTITLEVSATDTAAIDWKQGVYDLELVSPEGDVTTLVFGEVCVAPEVTTA